MWETLHNNAGWACSRTLTLTEILRTQNRPRVKFCAYFEVTRSFPQVGCERKKLLFRHSSTESEIISLGAGLRVDGIPALDLWALVIEVLHSSANQPKKSKENVQGNLLHDTPTRKQTENQVKTPIQYNDLELCNVDYVSSNVKSSRSGVMLCIFQDNEAVMKMIIKGRSPTVRHMSRTHRVALDCLIDGINLDPQIQIKYVDKKNQVPDTLTKGNFTRYEWNTLLHLFNFSIFSSASCPEEMSKRMIQEKRELWQSRSRR